MRGSEPLPGYNALSPEEIATALSGADAETVKAVRSQGTPVQGSLSLRPELVAEARAATPVWVESQLSVVRSSMDSSMSAARRSASGRVWRSA
jgi:hypothetical protein